jgi:predicted Zn-dependent peptidase
MILWGMWLVGSSRLSAETRVWKNQPERIAINDHFSFIYQQEQSSKITIVHLVIKGGKLGAPSAKRGLAFLSTRLAVELPSSDHLRKLMHLGSSIISYIDGDHSTITIRSLTENLEETLKVAAKVIKKPLFSSIRIANLKRFMKHRAKGEEDSPDAVMEKTYLTVFSGKGEYGYGGSIYGSEDSRKAIKRKDCIAFYKRYFNSANVVMSVCTDLDKLEITKILQKYFDSFPKGEAVELPQIQPSIPDKTSVFIEKDNQQVLISYGALLPDSGRENFAHIFLLDNLLGKGIGSRLWVLRSGLDLAYSLNTRFVQFKDAGLLMIQMKTDNSKKQDALIAFKALLEDIHKKGVTEEELQITKVRARADYLRSNETKTQRARQLAYFEAMGVDYSYMEDFFKALDSVTTESLNNYLKKVLDPERLVEVTIGPRAEESINN